MYCEALSFDQVPERRSATILDLFMLILNPSASIDSTASIEFQASKSSTALDAVTLGCINISYVSQLLLYSLSLKYSACSKDPQCIPSSYSSNFKGSAPLGTARK